jgi:leucyl aminopeptidase (aminopeptidase T)
MKEETKQVTMYVADDGKEFTHAWECKDYEAHSTIEKKRRDYLQENVSSMLHIRHPDVGFRIFSNNVAQMGYLEEDGENFEEFDEDFPFSIDDWDKFKDDVYIKFGYKIKIPLWYWGK